MSFITSYDRPTTCINSFRLKRTLTSWTLQKCYKHTNIAYCLKKGCVLSSLLNYYTHQDNILRLILELLCNF
uniref:Uncharacterized protein n=1 Tax=Anguilla anguilla TaxID=7936 RepID=A0A0E9UWW6_ANGAN